MSSSPSQPARWFRRAWLGPVGTALVVALLAVLTSPWWHHHDCEDHEHGSPSRAHDSCAICHAIHQPGGSGLEWLAPPAPPMTFSGVADAPSVERRRDLPRAVFEARGPPRASRPAFPHAPSRA